MTTALKGLLLAATLLVACDSAPAPRPQPEPIPRDYPCVVLPELVCDGVEHCDDGSDELDCEVFAMDLMSMEGWCGSCLDCSWYWKLADPPECPVHRVDKPR